MANQDKHIVTVSQMTASADALFKRAQEMEAAVETANSNFQPIFEMLGPVEARAREWTDLKKKLTEDLAKAKKTAETLRNMAQEYGELARKYGNTNI